MSPGPARRALKAMDPGYSREMVAVRRVAALDD